jgi:hypothetical protein
MVVMFGNHVLALRGDRVNGEIPAGKYQVVCQGQYKNEIIPVERLNG